jgi:hypothetical protein
MTDDPQRPAVDSAPPAELGHDPGVADAPSDSGNDRRNVVYLVPSIPSPADASDTHADPGAAPGISVFDPADDLPAEHSEREDWVWVQEWRAGREPTPWATGIALAAFSALIVGVAVWVLSAGLADRPVIAVLVNLLVAAGLTPAIWLSRGLPVLRWIAAGAAAGIIIGWVCAILMLPFPSA